MSKRDDEEKNLDDLSATWEEIYTALIAKGLLDGLEVCGNHFYLYL